MQWHIAKVHVCALRLELPNFVQKLRSFFCFRRLIIIWYTKKKINFRFQTAEPIFTSYFKLIKYKFFASKIQKVLIMFWQYQTKSATVCVAKALYSSFMPACVFSLLAPRIRELCHAPSVLSRLFAHSLSALRVR